MHGWLDQPNVTVVCLFHRCDTVRASRYSINTKTQQMTIHGIYPFADCSMKSLVSPSKFLSLRGECDSTIARWAIAQHINWELRLIWGNVCRWKGDPAEECWDSYKGDVQSNGAVNLLTMVRKSYLQVHTGKKKSKV